MQQKFVPLSLKQDHLFYLVDGMGVYLLVLQVQFVLIKTTISTFVSGITTLDICPDNRTISN